MGSMERTISPGSHGHPQKPRRGRVGGNIITDGPIRDALRKPMPVRSTNITLPAIADSHRRAMESPTPSAALVLFNEEIARIMVALDFDFSKSSRNLVRLCNFMLEANRTQVAILRAKATDLWKNKEDLAGAVKAYGELHELLGKNISLIQKAMEYVEDIKPGSSKLRSLSTDLFLEKSEMERLKIVVYIDRVNIKRDLETATSRQRK
jgi:hypothetical protein